MWRVVLRYRSAHFNRDASPIVLNLSAVSFYQPRKSRGGARVLDRRQKAWFLRGRLVRLRYQISISVSKIDTAWPMIQTPSMVPSLNSSSTFTRPGLWS
jgi:hypothetical protein